MRSDHVPNEARRLHQFGGLHFSLVKLDLVLEDEKKLPVDPLHYVVSLFAIGLVPAYLEPDDKLLRGSRVVVSLELRFVLDAHKFVIEAFGVCFELFCRRVEPVVVLVFISF